MKRVLLEPMPFVPEPLIATNSRRLLDWTELASVIDYLRGRQELADKIVLLSTHLSKVAPDNLHCLVNSLLNLVLSDRPSNGQCPQPLWTDL